MESGSRAAEVSQLIERARRGEPSGFRELFRLHLSAVHRLVYRLVGPSADLDDLVQTVFVEGFRSLPTFRGEALFSTWLGRIAVRVTLRSVRRPLLKLIPVEDTAAPDTRARPDEAMVEKEGLARLDALLATLKPKKRIAFVLHVLEGYSLDETAAIVGARPAAVKVRIHDARRDLERRARKDPFFAELLAGKMRA